MSPPALIITALQVFGLVTLAYFLILNSLYLLFSVVAFVRLRQHRRRWTSRELDAVIRSPATPGMSLLVPAFNEARTIGESVRALLLLNYPRFEVIVISDGSTDQTLRVLTGTFGLARAPFSASGSIPTEPVRGAFRSVANRDLLVLDKANGGKSDAINAGINAAAYPLVCVIDADSLLETHALSRAVLPFLEDPDTIAAGGIIRIVNGCTVAAGSVTRVALPWHPLALFQVVEYLRAFLAARVAFSSVNALLIISGAFGVFRRDALVEAGGFWRGTVGEDMEIVTRLHRAYRESGRRCRIVFQPEPVCWTEAPESLKVLSAQRRRWQRGTLEVMSRHRRMLANPAYGAPGCLGFPYYFIFEGLGPAFEVCGYMVTLGAVLLGMLDWRFAQLIILGAIVYGALISVMAVVLEEISFRRYRRVGQLLGLIACGVLENLGYRQLSTWWRLRGTLDHLLRRKGWGTMTRKGFG